MDEEVLNIGDEVLIFKYIREWGIDQDYKHYIKGYVINRKMSDDLSYHGSPWSVMNYTVIGEDGKDYFGNYKKPTLGDSFFMIQEDYVRYLEREIRGNQEKILEINKENQTLQKMIENVKNEKNQKVRQLSKRLV